MRVVEGAVFVSGQEHQSHCPFVACHMSIRLNLYTCMQPGPSVVSRLRSRLAPRTFAQYHASFCSFCFQQS